MLRQFFDSSALIKYYHDEIGSPKVQILVGASGSEHYVARLAWVEILSALAKKVRTGTIVASDYRRLELRLRADINRRLIRPLRMLNAHFRSGRGTHRQTSFAIEPIAEHRAGLTQNLDPDRR